MRELWELFQFSLYCHCKVRVSRNDFIITNRLHLPKGYTGKLSAIYRKQTALKTDERVRLMDEIIGGVQVIKMYAWEIPFGKIIRHARKLELKIVTKSSYIRGLYVTFNLFTTRIALFCTLLTMALSGQKITAAKVSLLTAQKTK